MEKKQYEICLKVLEKFEQSGVLKHLVLIGSWCVYFYKNYFNSNNYVPSIRTRDIDFLVPVPLKFKSEIDIPKILGDLGFLIDFKGSQGYIKFIHPELVVEFLVPEKGAG